ncbi:MAG: hypothetical protein ACFHWZ_07275 [Phycisphaerales bacterium]
MLAQADGLGGCAGGGGDRFAEQAGDDRGVFAGEVGIDGQFEARPGDGELARGVEEWPGLDGGGDGASGGFVAVDARDGVDADIGLAVEGQRALDGELGYADLFAGEFVAEAQVGDVEGHAQGREGDRLCARLLRGWGSGRGAFGGDRARGWSGRTRWRSISIQPESATVPRLRGEESRPNSERRTVRSAWPTTSPSGSSSSTLRRLLAGPGDGEGVDADAALDGVAGGGFDARDEQVAGEHRDEHGDGDDEQEHGGDRAEEQFLEDAAAAGGAVERGCAAAVCHGGSLTSAGSV